MESWQDRFTAHVDETITWLQTAKLRNENGEAPAHVRLALYTARRTLADAIAQTRST